MTIQRDDKGPEVVALQNKLLQLNYPIGEADGIFGLKTDIAIRHIQHQGKLEADGLVGPKTQLELTKAQPVPDGFSLTTVNWTTPYLTQRDNKFNPSGSCNVTSLAMVMSFHKTQPKIEGTQLEDELYSKLQEPAALNIFKKNFPDLARSGYSPRNVTPMLNWLAREYGFNSKSSENWTISQLVENTKTFGPFFTSGAFTSYGHIVCVTGFTVDLDWIVHDPWGDWNAGYRNSQNGKYRIYSNESMIDVIKGSERNKFRGSFIWKV